MIIILAIPFFKGIKGIYFGYTFFKGIKGIIFRY